MEPTNESSSAPVWTRGKSRVFTGFILIIAGLLLFAYKMGAPVPGWLFTWPVALIVVGLVIGVRHRFRNNAWIIMVAIGGINLLNQLSPNLNLDTYIAPIIIILIGLIFVLRPQRHFRKNWGELRQNYKDEMERSFDSESDSHSEDYIESVSVFGGVKKKIITKQFKGGDITCFMGGAEIDLTQADIQGKAILEVTQVFGGTKIIVSPNWDVKSEVVAVFGGIEDKRPAVAATIDNTKILILRGTSVFGGIDIRSY